jgi:CBS domain containing-hemolysin-like protein
MSTIGTIIFYDMLASKPELDSYVPIISSIAVTFVIYILGDILPKTIARKIPDTISMIFAWPLYIILIILTPISIIFEMFAKLIDKIFKTSQDEEFTEEDFETIVEQTTDEGILEEEQGDIIQSALEFEDTNVKEVLTPREKMFALDIRGLTHEKLQQILLETNYSRIPIYEKEFDNFIGVLLIKTYIKQYIDNPNTPIRKMLQKPYFVSSKIMIDDLFNGFKKHHSHLAIVRNKDKKVIGMVTMEDVLEEIVEGISEPNALKVRKA